MKRKSIFSFISLVSISLLSACSNNAKYSDLCKVYLENLRSADYIDNIDVSLELQDAAEREFGDSFLYVSKLTECPGYSKSDVDNLMRKYRQWYKENS